MSPARKSAPTFGPRHAQTESTEPSSLPARVPRMVAPSTAGITRSSPLAGGRVKKPFRLPAKTLAAAKASPLRSITSLSRGTPSSDIHTEQAEANKNKLADMLADYESSYGSARRGSSSAEPTPEDSPKPLQERLPQLPPAPRGEPPLPPGVQRRLYTVKNTIDAKSVMRSSRFCHHVRLIAAKHIKEGRSRRSMFPDFMHSLQTLIVWDAQRKAGLANGEGGKGKAKVKAEEDVSFTDVDTPLTTAKAHDAANSPVMADELSEGDEIMVASAVKEQPFTPNIYAAADAAKVEAGGKERQQIMEFNSGETDTVTNDYDAGERQEQQQVVDRNGGDADMVTDAGGKEQQATGTHNEAAFDRQKTLWQGVDDAGGAHDLEMDDEADSFPFTRLSLPSVAGQVDDFE